MPDYFHDFIHPLRYIYIVTSYYAIFDLKYNFVETTRKFTIAKLSIRIIIVISTDEDPRLLLALMKIRDYHYNVDEDPSLQI